MLFIKPVVWGLCNLRELLDLRKILGWLWVSSSCRASYERLWWIMAQLASVLSCLWVNASLCAHSFMKHVCARGPHAHLSTSLGLCCEHFWAALFQLQVLGSLFEMPVVLENCRLFRCCTVTSRSFDSNLNWTCGSSKQKCWCVYEYLKFAWAEMWTFTSELEVWRRTDGTASRFFPSLLKEEIVHHDVFC